MTGTHQARRQAPWPRLATTLAAAALSLLAGCSIGDLPDVPVICGDGFVEGDEQCDDGNAIDGDGCSSTCELIGTGGEQNCTDAVDNDGDGRLDCNDPDCAGDTACETTLAELCDNALDDDLDGQVDCVDSDCAMDAVCTVSGESLCANGRDDDEDGRTDCDDPDCDMRACASHGQRCASQSCVCPGGTTETACTDGADDDCDGMSDCRDPDCAVDPACAAGFEDACGDGMDNDGNGAIDCADGNCAAQPCGPNGRVCVQSMCICPGGGSEGACQDGLDNDCDGDADCDDLDCSDDMVCGERETNCGDLGDNDGDGLTDCDDSDCLGSVCGDMGQRCAGGTCTCPGGATEAACNDGVDNDCDGTADCADSDCLASSCGDDGLECLAGGTCGCPGGTTEMACDDQTDNDCDGLVDCDDPDCSAQPGCSEVTCGDGVDNDLDGDADCLDADCAAQSCDEQGRVCASFNCTCPGGATETACTDDVDDDCDGQLDCADSDCAGDPACSVMCDVDNLLLCNFEVSHSTVGFGSDVPGYACNPADQSGPERIYTFLATTDSSVVLRLSNPSADLDLTLLSDVPGQSCDPQSCLDASATTGGAEVLTLQATAGTTYQVAVDGKNGASGSYDLEFECSGGTSCAASAVVSCGSSDSWQTTGTDSTDVIDGYSCEGWSETGPEYAYLFVPDVSGTATAVLSTAGSTNPADLDVFVLPFNDGVCDPTGCLVAGDSSAAWQVTAGEPYLVVVDGYQGASGDYSVTFNCIP